MRDSSKFRMTKQREVVLSELQKSIKHPTADEVYEMVRKHVHRISLGTVYRNLENLAEEGLINRIEGIPMRFDARTDDHYHIRCKHCSKIADLPSNGQVNIEETVENLDDWKITGHEFELLGICPECSEQIHDK